MKQWISVWSQANTSFWPLYSLKNRTVSAKLPLYTDGDGLRFRFYNREIKGGYEIGPISIYFKGQYFPLSFDGKDTLRLPYDRVICSDELSVPVRNGDTLEIRIFTSSGKLSGNFQNLHAKLSVKGDYTKGNFVEKDLTRRNAFAEGLNCYLPLPGLAYIDVCSDRAKHGIVAFGDSITQLGQWTTPVCKQLSEETRGTVVLLNEGIGGNRVLYDGAFRPYGRNAADRMNADVFGCLGADIVLFAIGTNDIGLPGGGIFGAPKKEFVDLEKLKRAYLNICARVHDNGKQFIMTTILPRGVSQNHVYGKEKEAVRLAINRWIREQSAWDYLIDYEPDFVEKGTVRLDLLKADQLHPNAEGGRVMADRLLHTLHSAAACSDWWDS